MADRLRLVVWTPSETVVEAEQVEWVHVKLAGARALTVWPEHAPLLAETAREALRYADADGTHAIDLPAGVLQVQGSTVTLFLAGTLDEQSRTGVEDRPPAEQAGPRHAEERYKRLAETMLAGRA